MKIDVHPLNKSFNPGDNVTLTCLVEHGGPVDVIHWYKDDQLIRANNHSNSSQLAEISLVSLIRTDAGRYKCTVWKKQVEDTAFIDLHINGNNNYSDHWDSGFREVNSEITSAIPDK